MENSKEKIEDAYKKFNDYLKAKQLAKELKTRCDYEEDYTYEEYLKDMERDNLYNEAEKRIKKE